MNVPSLSIMQEFEKKQMCLRLGNVWKRALVSSILEYQILFIYENTTVMDYFISRLEYVCECVSLASVLMAFLRI